IDNGMPVVIVRADALGLAGDETPAVLEANTEVTATLERIRLHAGVLMGLGDVSVSSSPKVALVSPPRHGGAIDTRCFIPQRVHTSIGVFAAISVATAATFNSGPAMEVARLPEGPLFQIEHPTGMFEVHLTIGAE